MSIDPRAPCLIGVAQHTWHPGDVGAEGAPEPLDMWELVARQAAADAGAPGAVEKLEHLDVVYCQSWQYDEPARRLAERLGAEPRQAAYSGIGGSVPQVLVARAAEAVQAGDLDLALVVGAEALATRRRLAKEGRKPSWSHPPAEKRPFPFDIPFNQAEVAHGIYEAFLTFALFDNARRHHLGLGLDDYRRHLGSALSRLSEVAASNPHAWFPQRRDATEITTPTAENRMVSYPYTKLMTAIMDVDMAAAVLLASHERADALGVPADQRVYLRGWAYAQDPNYVAERRELWRSAAMEVASRGALETTGLHVDDVAYLDLYSCFGSSLEFAADALDLSGPSGQPPGRPLTVTGGLPYHGGPGSNYMTHAIATMARRLRAHPGSYGLVSGVGMHMTKHVYGLWSTEPGNLARPNLSALQAQVDRRTEIAPIHTTYEGPATVATYSVLHGRDGEPQWAALVCDLPDEGRCYARLEDPDTLSAAEAHELVGARVVLEPAARGVNRATFVA